MGYSRFIIAVLPIPMDGAICKPTCGSGNLRPHCSEEDFLASWHPESLFLELLPSKGTEDEWNCSSFAVSEQYPGHFAMCG